MGHINTYDKVGHLIKNSRGHLGKILIEDCNDFCGDIDCPYARIIYENCPSIGIHKYHDFHGCAVKIIDIYGIP